MKTISLQDLFDKEACFSGIYLYYKMGGQHVHWDEVNTITIHDSLDGERDDWFEDDLLWFCEEFKLSLTVIDEAALKIAVLENGKPVYVEIQGDDPTVKIYQYDKYGTQLYHECFKQSSTSSWYVNNVDKYGRIVDGLHSSGYWTKMIYDIHGNVISQSNNQSTTNHNYDDLGRLMRTILKYATDGGGLAVDSEYDQHNNRMKKIQTQFNQSNEPISETVITYEYDDQGRILKSRHGTMLEASWEYDSHGRMIRATEGEHTKEWVYDVDGQLTKVTDKSDESETRFYYENGKLSSLEIYEIYEPWLPTIPKITLQ
jgi:YD repeat-containing protein